MRRFRIPLALFCVFVLGLIAGAAWAGARCKQDLAQTVWRMQTGEVDARIEAVRELARRKDTRTLLPLIATATMDLEPKVRNLATAVLGSFRSEAVVPALCALLHDESIEVRTTAAMNLAVIGEPAIDEVRAVYLQGHPVSCMFAALALSRIEHPSVRTIFEEGAASESPEAKKWAENLGGQRKIDLAVRALLDQ